MKTKCTKPSLLASLVAALSFFQAEIAFTQSVSPGSDNFVTKGLIYVQTAATAPDLATQNAAVFEASAPGLGGPSVLPGAAVALTWPAGGPVNLSYNAATGVFPLTAANNTQSALDAAYPAGNYMFAFKSQYINFNNTLALPADNFPAPPQFANYAAAQQVNASQSFTLNFNPFPNAAAPDDVTLEILDASGSLLLSNSLSLTASSATLNANLLGPAQAYSVHLRFRQLTRLSGNTVSGVVGFFSETRMSLVTASGQSGSPPALTNTIPLAGQLIPSGSPLVLQFSEPMSQGDIAIAWTQMLHGTAVPLNPASFTYLWTDPQTLACSYGSFDTPWPQGLIAWTVNPTPGAVGNFQSTGGLALPSLSGNFVAPGGPWSCALETNQTVEAPAFYLAKAARYLQTGQSAPVADPASAAQLLAYLQLPYHNGGAPLALVIPPTNSTSRGLVMTSRETSADLLAGRLVETSSSLAANTTVLDDEFPSGQYVLELAEPNPQSSQASPIPTNSVSLLLTNLYYPPAPQFVSEGVIPPSSITNGLTVSWEPWAGASANSFVTFKILDPSSNVVFSAPNLCANLPLPAAATSLAIPANTLSNGVPYQMELSFISLSDSSAALTNVPGWGYAALESITRLSLLSYMSPPPAISITAPSAGAIVPSGHLSVQVNASQPSGFLSQLQLFSGPNLLTTLPLGPGVTNYNGAISASIPAGPQNLFVAATDNNGQQAMAGPLAIVAQSPNFVVALSAPANAATYPPFPTIELTATAQSPTAPIADVQFFMDGNPLGTATSAPYTASVYQVIPGAHQFYAKAFDALGFGGISPTLSVTVASLQINQTMPFLGADGSFSVGFGGKPGGGFVLEAATNLTAPVHWVPVQTKIISGAQEVFSDSSSSQFANRFYRIVSLAGLTNAPAFSVSGQDLPTAAISNTFDLLQGLSLTLNASNGVSSTLTLLPGAMDLSEPVSLTSVASLQDYPFDGPLIAAVDISSPESDLGVTATLTVQLPPGVPTNSVAAFAYHQPNGELYLTPFAFTNIVQNSSTNHALVIPINRLGGCGIAALTAADLARAALYQPTDSADNLDQATALALLTGVVTNHAAPRGASPRDDSQLVQQLLDQFDSVYQSMQGVIDTGGDYTSGQFASWDRWLSDLYAAGLQDQFSVQLAQFAQAIDAIYSARIETLIKSADQNHDWTSIAKLMNFDLSGKLNNSLSAQGWQPGQSEALQAEIDNCLTFEFDFDSLMENDNSVGTELSHLTAQATFQQGNPSTKYTVKGQATPDWTQTQFPPVQQCSPATAAPTTPPFEILGFNIAGTKSTDLLGNTTYNVTGIQMMIWPSNPMENFSTTCQGFYAPLGSFWWPEFGWLYKDDLIGFPSNGKALPQAAFKITDHWQIGGGGGDAVLATRDGHDNDQFSDGSTIQETATYQLQHTPQ